MKKILIAVLCVTLSLSAYAQQSAQDKEEQEKKLNEYILSEVERLEMSLKLEDWQVFYVDSILNHNYHAMQDEISELSDSKVSNYDIYAIAQDKWMEETYLAMNKVLNDEQWTKYLKSGAAKDKKARDKRKEKRNTEAIRKD